MSAATHAQAATSLSGWKLPAAIAAAIVLVLILASVLRASDRMVPRPRRAVPKALLLLLSPIYRYDPERDAWILRVAGNHVGPVLRPRGYRSRHQREAEEEEARLLLMSARLDEPGTPDLFAPPATIRARRRRRDRIRGGPDQDHEPPPLPIQPNGRKRGDEPPELPLERPPD